MATSSATPPATPQPPPPSTTATDALAIVLQSNLIPDECKKRLGVWALIQTLYSDHVDILRLLFSKEDGRFVDAHTRDEICKIMCESNARLDVIIQLEGGGELPYDKSAPMTEQEGKEEATP